MAALLVLSAVAINVASTSNAANVDDHKVTICHRTNSVTNPYVSITVDTNAADGISGNSKGNPDDHYGEHQGPLVTTQAQAQALKTAKIQWGDIIPPIAGAHDGLNWTAAGQAIYSNGCNYLPTVATATITFTPPTCESGEVLNYGQTTNASFSALSTPNGTTGPAPYNVVAVANQGSAFADVPGVSFDKKSINFAGTLAGKLTGAQCENPEVRTASAGISFTPATCQVGEGIVYGSITYATFSPDSTASGTKGPLVYTVVANASLGAQFNPGPDVTNNNTTRTFTGTLSGPLTGPECNPDVDLKVASATISIEDATCEAGEKLVYGDAINAFFDEASTPDGTTGPTDYSVVVIANDDAEFEDAEGVSNANTVLTFSGTLAGPLTGDDCVLGEETPVVPTTPVTPATPSTPAVLPDTNAGSATILFGSVAGTLAVIGLAGAVLRKTLYRGL